MYRKFEKIVQNTKVFIYVTPSFWQPFDAQEDTQLTKPHRAVNVDL